MRFEFSIALKYLVPRFRQLSVAIISVVSTLVVSMVVWLVLVFLSVTDGLEKKWIEELVSINAPIRMAPNDAYYSSYYYLIDSFSADGNYSTKSLGEKLSAGTSDPYDPSFDGELPYDFPLPDKNELGETKNLVEEAMDAVTSLEKHYKGLRAKEYEVSFGTLQLALGDNSYVSQVSYVASHHLGESQLKKMILPPTVEDYQHILKMHLQQGEKDILRKFFAQVQIDELKPSSSGYILTEELYPKEGSVQAIALLNENRVSKIWLSEPVESALLTGTYSKGVLEFREGTPFFDNKRVTAPIIVGDEVRFTASVDMSSLQQRSPMADIRFHVTAPVQSLLLTGTIYLDNLQFSKVTPLITNEPPLWVCTEGSCTIPSSAQEHGVLIAKQFKKNGVRLGERGTISYSAPTLNSIQEQKLPIFVAGFYDPGLFPMGSKLIFVEPSVTAQLRSNVAVSDTMLGNGFNLWIDNNDQAESVKTALQEELTKRGIGQYWHVESFNDYEFAKPILTQLKSDKNLFTLIAIIILVVACSNIISMLILLVNDKRREIAIMQAMGASSARIGLIFGICGCIIGLLSSLIGIGLSLFTLKHLQSLVDFLSFLQGHDAFQAAFYGNELPNKLSISALLFVFIATTAISLVAALVPAIKASKIKPSQMLRAEG